MKRNRLMWTAALLALMHVAPSFAEDSNALIEAARKGDTATVRALISAGANVDAANEYGTTALILAAVCEHTGVNPRWCDDAFAFMRASMILRVRI